MACRSRQRLGGEALSSALRRPAPRGLRRTCCKCAAGIEGLEAGSHELLCDGITATAAEVFDKCDDRQLMAYVEGIGRREQHQNLLGPSFSVKSGWEGRVVIGSRDNSKEVEAAPPSNLTPRFSPSRCLTAGMVNCSSYMCHPPSNTSGLDGLAWLRYCKVQATGES